MISVRLGGGESEDEWVGSLYAPAEFDVGSAKAIVNVSSNFENPFKDRTMNA